MSLTRIASLLLAAAVSIPVAAPAAERLPPAPRPLVLSSTAAGYRVRVPTGEAVVARERVEGYDLAEIRIPDGVATSDEGPSLPLRTVLLRIPPGVDPIARATRVGLRSLGPLEPTPIPRLVTDPSVRARLEPGAVQAAMRGRGYRALGGEREPDVVAVQTIMRSRGERFLAVTLRPVTWDPVTREARVADEIRVDVSWDPPATALPSEAIVAAPDLGLRSAPPRAARAPARVAATSPLRVDPSRPWVRLGVVRPGLYRVTAAALAGAGVSTAGLDPSTFRLFRSAPGDLPPDVDVDAGPDSLRECAITVTGEGDGSFDPSDAIYFYGTGESGFGYDLKAGGGAEYQETQRTDLQPHWLTWGPGPLATPPRRIALRDAAPTGAPAPLLTQVTHRVHFEDNRFLHVDLFAPGYRWERWFMNPIPPGQRLAFPITLPGAVAGGAVEARLRMWSDPTAVGRNAALWWNGVPVDSVFYNLLPPGDLVAGGLRTNGARDTIQAQALPIPAGLQYLAWFEVSYPRALVAAADTVTFAAPDSVAPGRFRYAISGVSDTSAAWLLDRTDPESPVRLVNGAWSGVSPSFALTVEDSAGGGYRPRYSLLSTARAGTPTIDRYAPASSAHSISDLLDTANAADYLIVAPPGLVPGAEELAADRDTLLPGFANPRAAIATTDRIAAQFGGGRSDPVALRNLFAYAARRWTAPPLYVCLLGDASDDPKNYSRIAGPDLVPVYNGYFDTQIPSGPVKFISDDFYAFLDGPGDQIFDLAIGRLPARDLNDAFTLVRGKRVTYERTREFDAWRIRALLSADDGWKWATLVTQRDPVGAAHVNQSERKDIFHIPFPIRREKVYLNDYPFADSTHRSKPAAREAFIAAINRGNWLVEFAGHGSENFLADEQLFRASDLSRLTNASRPSIFGFFSCTVGKFDDNVHTDDLAELLLRHPGGGAVVSLAATEEVFPFESGVLNDNFMDALFPDPSRVDTLRTAGLAWALGKSVPSSQNVVARKYNYLGDPALMPPLPRGRGVFDSLDAGVKSPLDSIPRGAIVVFGGRALNEDGTTDVTASGPVEVEVLGPPSRRIEIADFARGASAVPYALPGPVLYRGATTLDQGRFTARFAIPTDGRLIGPGCQIRALLARAGGEDGLAADSFRIASALSPRVDPTPPTIRLLGTAGSDSTVAPGSVLTFALEDSSGIDLSRLDDAHSIFVIVDDRGTPIDITPTFRYEPSSFTRGTATLVLPQLAAGAHLLEVHASDSYRNVAKATFMIDVGTSVSAGASLVLSEVFNYPNPFPRETFLHARLNQAARLHVQILTVSGRRVRDFVQDGKAGENYIPWDGRDSQGEKVALGVYIVKLTAEVPGGNRATAIARALRAE